MTTIGFHGTTAKAASSIRQDNKFKYSKENAGIRGSGVYFWEGIPEFDDICINFALQWKKNQKLEKPYECIKAEITVEDKNFISLDDKEVKSSFMQICKQHSFKPENFAGNKKGFDEYLIKIGQIYNILFDKLNKNGIEIFVCRCNIPLANNMNCYKWSMGNPTSLLIRKLDCINILAYIKETEVQND